MAPAARLTRRSACRCWRSLTSMASISKGACEGSLACSTCHVIVDPAWFKKLESPTEDEEDMLDLAFGLTQTSRLGCQIVMTDELDGLVVKLPAATRNAQG